ncbi:MAG: hypothetical protein ACK521_03320 [bacterium]
MQNPSYINILKQHYGPPTNPMNAGPLSYRYEDHNMSMVSAGMVNLNVIQPQESVLCMIC